MEQITYYQRYYRKHKEKRKAQFKKYYQDNKDYWIQYGVKRDKDMHKEYCRKWRERNKLRRALTLKRNRFVRLKSGPLTVKVLQLVYEDNIKKYSTLTCYLCLKPIDFGNDCIEHKIPLSREGTNEYNNLEVSCMNCNSRKHTRTVIEYKEYLSKVK